LSDVEVVLMKFHPSVFYEYNAISGDTSAKKKVFEDFKQTFY